MGRRQDPPDIDLRLLVVDDIDADAELIIEMLDEELRTAQVTLVSTPADALTLNQGFDVVVADLSNLPDDGLGFVAALHSAWPDTALIMVNGRAVRSVAVAAIDAGAGDYLDRGSCNARSLVTAVLHAVQRTRAAARGRHGQELATSLVAVVEEPTCLVAADGTILAVNAAWRAGATANGGRPQTCGVGVDYLAICDGATGASSDGTSQVADGLRAVLAGRSSRFVFEYPYESPTEQRWFSLRVLPQPGGTGAVVTHHDVTALKVAEREISRRATYDQLTDLPNRALLTDRLEQALDAASRARRRVAVAFVALDQFKRVNDTFGHAAGDALLLKVATRLALRMRHGDTLARFSGDEFVVVWRDLVLAEDAKALSERLAQAFEEPFLLADAHLSVTASIGVSGDQWAQTADELILAADAAMQEAKRHGRGRVQFFSPELRERASATMRTGLGLRAAMDSHELVLHYQPVVDLSRGAVVGVEALIRWQHPTDGLIGPDLFIPVAEAEGLIVELGEWVLEQAAGQAVRWYDEGLRLDMAVNVSTRQVAHPSLVPALSRVVRESGIDPRHLVLEVTESAVMEDAEAAAEVFDAITALGISLAIDDFGTGYSSLVYLKRYLIAALKIDRSFTAGMGVYAEDDAIVASVIGLAKAVGGFCIAEGIETAEQYAALRSLNCGFGQGWLFGKAVPPEDLPDLILRCEAKLALLERTIPTGSGEVRDEIADQRDQIADERDQTADERDKVADERDKVADERDESGDERDHAADEREQSGDERDQSGDERDQASGRTRASQDRQAGESERDLAGLDRDSALAARGVSARSRHTAAHERGVYLPVAGLVQLEREMARARRKEMPLVLAFIDFDRVKAVNDSPGDPAGDRILLEVANALGAKVRSYDLILRPGGDGFVWALSGLSLSQVTERLALVNAALAEGPRPGLVRFGLAELRQGDSPKDLVERASGALHLTTPSSDSPETAVPSREKSMGYDDIAEHPS